jgi:hypothetical protein
MSHDESSFQTPSGEVGSQMTEDDRALLNSELRAMTVRIDALMTTLAEAKAQLATIDVRLDRMVNFYYLIAGVTAAGGGTSLFALAKAFHL